MDFFTVDVLNTNKGNELMPTFLSKKFKDFMVRGKSFYAVWDEDTGLWSKDDTKAIEFIDRELQEKKDILTSQGVMVSKVHWMHTFRIKESNSISSYRSWMQNLPDICHPLDTKVVYLSQQTTKKDYASHRLPYDLSDDGNPEAFSELMSTIYDPDERRKLEWAIGAVLNGDVEKIQKFVVLYGDAGSGKSTFLHILEQVFEGYWTTFDASSLTNRNDNFCTQFMKESPLVAIQHDGNLARIEDNSLLNSIVSHEDILVNEKFKPHYVDRARCMLFLGTNSPVKISDARSGLTRRLIDVSPSGRKVPITRYNELMDMIPYELGKIARRCLNVYRSLGRHYYDAYRPVRMMRATDVFYNFVEENQLFFEHNDPMELKMAYEKYKVYCDESNAQFISQRYKFRDELTAYFTSYDYKTMTFIGFRSDKLGDGELVVGNETIPEWIRMRDVESIFDKECADCPAQYGNAEGTPFDKWENVTKTLSDIDTSKLHYVRVPENHIVIDFDMKNDKGEKDQTLNILEASKFPPTYAEWSKGGNGIHLHYIYDGDVSKLSRLYKEDVEIKVFNGKSSLRRKLTKCNNLPISHISSGLPLKEDKKVVNANTIKDEQHLRNLIAKNLRKEIHQYTKPSVDYIYKLLEDAYNSGMEYDVRDMKQKIVTFAMKSTHQSGACLEIVEKMHLCSEHEDFTPGNGEYVDERLVFFDCEVFPNLFIICWKFDGVDHVTKMINPSPREVGKLFRYKLVGFNNRRYDNHILYARYIGYSNEELFNLSQYIVDEKKGGAHFFKEAYNLSYTDVYDFASAANKKGLKKWEIELHIHHQENAYPWDEPVDESHWLDIADYCANDVEATEIVFHHLDGDWKAREMLAVLAGGSVNDTTNQLTTKFIFEGNRHPELVYTNLKTGERTDGTIDPLHFPEYEYINGKNYFRGYEVGKGGYVWAKPGMYEDVTTYDVAGMHPSSIIALNYFGKYTPRFKDMVGARTHIKHKELEIAASILNGALAPYLEDSANTKSVSNALKTGNNSCYGLSSAAFDNPMKHPLNVNNIVALRGALFIAQLRDELVAMGVEVIHVKTDSLKVVHTTPEVQEYVYKRGKEYGYNFEIEHHFERLCLINDAVYIGKLSADDPESPGQWTATGAQFAHPYIFKTLFSKEPVEFYDICETKSVNGKMYLDFNEGLGEGEHRYVFIGRVGLFTPVRSGFGGGELLVRRDDKYSAVAGTKGYRWLEAEEVKLLSKEDAIDMAYYHNLADKAVEAISKFGDFEWFTREE